MAFPVETINTRPGRQARAITPNDSGDLRLSNQDGTKTECRSLYVGGAGDVAILASGDTASVVWKAVPAGAIVPVEARTVLATGTTATNIVAIY